MILLRVAGIWRRMWCAQGVGHKEPAENTLTIPLPDRHSQTSGGQSELGLWKRLRRIRCFCLGCGDVLKSAALLTWWLGVPQEQSQFASRCFTKTKRRGRSISRRWVSSESQTSRRTRRTCSVLWSDKQHSPGAGERRLLSLWWLNIRRLLGKYPLKRVVQTFGRKEEELLSAVSQMASTPGWQHLLFLMSSAIQKQNIWSCHVASPFGRALTSPNQMRPNNCELNNMNDSWRRETHAAHRGLPAALPGKAEKAMNMHQTLILLCACACACA